MTTNRPVVWQLVLRQSRDGPALSRQNRILTIDRGEVYRASSQAGPGNDINAGDGAGFAVVLMTPDDVGKAKDAPDVKSRARQNVVFELGFFIGKIGPERVAALVKGDIELPSDYDGVVYISLDKEDWKTKLGAELKTAGYKIDWNKIHE